LRRSNQSWRTGLGGADCCADAVSGRAAAALLAAMGGINCLMRGTVSEIVAAPGGVDFVLAFLAEIVAVVNAVGHPMNEEFLAGARAVLTAKGSVQTSSMYRHLQQGSPIEADHIRSSATCWPVDGEPGSPHRSSPPHTRISRSTKRVSNEKNSNHIRHGHRPSVA
jgi:Ketopantoate reductase PanE/ApbA C terminal